MGHVGRRRARSPCLPPPGQESPLGLDGVASATKELVDREVRRIVDECYDEAVATLVAHREQLDRLAQALFAKETLDEDEAYAAAGVPRDAAPGALARGDVPGVPPEPGMLPKPATDGSAPPVAAPSLPEGEHVGLGAGVGEGDLERALGDRTVLADQLVEPLLGDGPGALLVDVEPAASRAAASRRPSPGSGFGRRRPGAQHQVDVAALEAVHDPAAGLVQGGDLLSHRPVAGRGPTG